jgi:hypothetical protein
MMTQNEAIQRANKIWPNKKFILTPDRHTDHWWIDVVPLAQGEAHILDGNGHACCHERCTRLEHERT